MKFYLFDQNNSGGNFTVDNELSSIVFIEAENAEEANSIAEAIGIYFDGCMKGIDCSCCGDRWYPVNERDGLASRKEVYDAIQDRKWRTTFSEFYNAPYWRIHLQNGFIESECVTSRA